VEPAEEGGQWWLPENPDVKVPGVLRIDDKGRSQLTLVGELRDRLHGAERHDRADGSAEFRFTESGFDRSGGYPRVVGRTQSSKYTLVHGLRTRHSTNLIGGSPARRSYSTRFSVASGLSTARSWHSTESRWTCNG
jgi:hypothetical protein